MKHDTPPAYFEVNVVNSNRIWQTDNVLKTGVVYNAATIIAVIVVSRFCFFIFKPFHQSRIIAHITVSI
jgi:hypothetical protein